LAPEEIKFGAGVRYTTYKSGCTFSNVATLQRAGVTLGKAKIVAFAQSRFRRAERAVSMVKTVFWHVTPFSLVLMEMG
jgi:hypothetical protein